MLTFPCFKFATWRPRLSGRVVTGPQSTSGQIQTAKTDGGGRWMFELGDANLNDRLALKAWRAFEAILDAGVTEVILELCDRRQMPGFESAPAPYGVPHSDGTPFSDGTLYGQPTIPETLTTVDASLRAVTLSLDNAAGIQGGEYFSIEHPNAGWRLYLVGQVFGDQITFRPPLREAVASGVRVEFERPRCVVRLIDPDAYAATVTRLRFAKGGAVFMESFDYAGS